MDECIITTCKGWTIMTIYFSLYYKEGQGMAKLLNIRNYNFFWMNA
jgi:hypothetical protein